MMGAPAVATTAETVPETAAETIAMPTSDSPGLYVHVPFCSAVCPYCDFAVARAAAGARERYVELLLREAESWGEEWLRLVGGAPFGTVYLGGGTPSILAPDQLDRLVGGLTRRLPVPADTWLALEANPEDVTPERLEHLRRLGVRTLSLGVQSFDPRALKFLGRRHTPEQAEAAVEQALAAGFHTVSVDLIFGLPADRTGPGALARSLECLVALRPQHVSCYQLTVHEGTPFGRGLDRGVIRELPEAAQAEAYERVVGTLAAAGYAAYEVSNFALSPEAADEAAGEGKDHRSRHNRKYWRHVPYLGLGPGAHSFVPLGGRRRGRRWWNERSIPVWTERMGRVGRPEAGGRPVAGEEELGPDAMALEAAMLGLRTADGVDLEDFRERFGVDLVGRNQALVERLAEEGLVEVTEGRLRPTARGFAVADGLPVGFEVDAER